MTLFKRREKFNWLSIKVGLVFSNIPISPNIWTLLSILPALVATYFLVRQEFLVSAAFFLVSSFLDVVDGGVAKVTGRVSKLGAYLDTVVDRYVEGAIIIGLLFLPLPQVYVSPKYWILIFLFGSLMTTYVKAAAKEKEIILGKEIKGGVLERAERLLILFAGIVLASFSLIYLTYIITLLAVLSNISALQRILSAVQLARTNKGPLSE